jgi:AAA family ATP:ADP antiporter
MSVLLQRITQLRPGEGLRVVLAGAWFCCLLTTNYALRPLREAMGVAGGVDSLHWLFTATFVVMLAAVPLYGLAVARFGRRRLVPVVHRFFILNLAVFFVLMQGWLGEGEALRLWTARVFFVWTSVFNLFVISLFWSVMADLFASADARRLFGLISVGGSLGAIAGPTIAGALAWWIDPAWLPLLGALLLELALAAKRGLTTLPHPGDETASRVSPSAPRPPRETEPDEAEEDRPIGGSPFAAIPDLLRSPILLGICAYVLLLTVSSTVLYFIQARIVAANFDDDATRTTVFAAIDLAVNLLTLVGQALLTGRLIRRLGLGWALAALPLVCVAGFVCLAAAPVLAVLAGVQILRRTGNYALAKPAREVLFTAVDRSQRYKAKSLIDTVIYRGGDALTGWAFAGLKTLGLGLGTIALLSAPLAGVWALVGLWLGRRSPAAGTQLNGEAPSTAADRAQSR